MWNALSRTCELCLRSFLYLFKKQEAAYPRAFQHYKYISFVYKTLIEKSMTQLYTLLYMFIKQLLRKLSTITWIIKTEVWVIYQNWRLRQITKTWCLIIYDIKWINSVIVSLQILKKNLEKKTHISRSVKVWEHFME